MPQVHTGDDDQSTGRITMERIAHLVSQVRVERGQIVADPDVWRECVAMCAKVHGFRPSSSCPSCHLTVLDILRRHIGLPAWRTEVSEDTAERRKAICKGCPIYRPKTDSCGRLFIDAVTPKPVKMGGKEVQPCGCIISLKAHIRGAECPAKLWPRR